MDLHQQPHQQPPDQEGLQGGDVARAPIFQHMYSVDTRALTEEESSANVSLKRDSLKLVGKIVYKSDQYFFFNCLAWWPAFQIGELGRCCGALPAKALMNRMYFLNTPLLIYWACLQMGSSAAEAQQTLSDLRGGKFSQCEFGQRVFEDNYVILRFCY